MRTCMRARVISAQHTRVYGTYYPSTRARNTPRSEGVYATRRDVATRERDERNYLKFDTGKKGEKMLSGDIK